MGLIRSVIGVLAEDDDFHLGVRCQVQRSEDLIGWWVDGALCSLSGNEGLELGPVLLVELAPQQRIPIGHCVANAVTNAAVC